MRLISSEDFQLQCDFSERNPESGIKEELKMFNSSIELWIFSIDNLALEYRAFQPRCGGSSGCDHKLGFGELLFPIFSYTVLIHDSCKAALPQEKAVVEITFSDDGFNELKTLPGSNALSLIVSFAYVVQELLKANDQLPFSLLLIYLLTSP